MVDTCFDLLKMQSKARNGELESMLLANLSRARNGAVLIMQQGTEREGRHIRWAIDKFVEPYEEGKDYFENLSYVLTNISQLESGRRLLMDTKRGRVTCPRKTHIVREDTHLHTHHLHIYTLIPISRYLPPRPPSFLSLHLLGCWRKLGPQLETDSEPRKLGVLYAIRNCCMNETYQTTLLSPGLGLYSKLVVPIIGPEKLKEEVGNSYWFSFFLPISCRFENRNTPMCKATEGKGKCVLGPT